MCTAPSASTMFLMNQWNKRQSWKIVIKALYCGLTWSQHSQKKISSKCFFFDKYLNSFESLISNNYASPRKILKPNKMDFFFFRIFLLRWCLNRISFRCEIELSCILYRTAFDVHYLFSLSLALSFYCESLSIIWRREKWKTLPPWRCDNFP